MDPGGRTFSWRVEWATMDYDWNSGLWTRHFVGSQTFAREDAANIFATQKRRFQYFTNVVRIVEDSMGWQYPLLPLISNPQEANR